MSQIKTYLAKEDFREFDVIATKLGLTRYELAQTAIKKFVYGESQSTRGPPGEKNDVHAKNTGVEHDSPGAGASEPPVEEEEAPGESPVGDFQGKLPVLVGGEGVPKNVLGVITGGRGGSTGEPTTKGAS